LQQFIGHLLTQFCQQSAQPLSSNEMRERLALSGCHARKGQESVAFFNTKMSASFLKKRQTD
jgi:hypothetical protein